RGYPLRGHLKVADAPFAPGRRSDQLPARGEAWADSRLLARLDVPAGGTLKVGELSLKGTHALDYRPDPGSAFDPLPPAILISYEDMAETGLLKPGSRATWNLLFAGAPAEIAGFEAWLRLAKSPAERLIDVGESSAQLKSAMERSGRFLNLSALATL